MEKLVKTDVARLVVTDENEQVKNIGVKERIRCCGFLRIFTYTDDWLG